MLPPNLTDDQAIQVIRAQIEALRNRKHVAGAIVNLCTQGVITLQQAPAPSMMTIGESVTALQTALLHLIQANLLANETSFAEIAEQLAQLEKTLDARQSKIHLGQFVPRLK